MNRVRMAIFWEHLVAERGSNDPSTDAEQLGHRAAESRSPYTLGGSAGAACSGPRFAGRAQHGDP